MFGYEYKSLQNGNTELTGSTQMVSVLLTNPAYMAGLRRGEAYSFANVAELSTNDDDHDLDEDASHNSNVSSMIFNENEICVAFDGRSALSCFSNTTSSEPFSVSANPEPSLSKIISYFVITQTRLR